MHTKFEVSSLSCSRELGGLKFKISHAHFRDGLSTVGWEPVKPLGKHSEIFNGFTHAHTDSRLLF